MVGDQRKIGIARGDQRDRRKIHRKDRRAPDGFERRRRQVEIARPRELNPRQQQHRDR
jgi:hypothetical protein